MTNPLYRIRPIKHLLGKHQELRQQKIYFARPDDLNDPMEGFRDIVWKGDDVVWTNLFSNYISTLNLTMIMVRLTGDTDAITPETLPVEGLVSETPTPMETSILAEILTNVFERCQLQHLITGLESINQAVRRDELLFYLKTIHYVALEEIQNTHIRHQLTSDDSRSRPQMNPPGYLARLPGLIRQLYQENPTLPSSATSILFSVYNRMYDNLNVLRKYDTREQGNTTDGVLQSNRELIILDFPRIYLSQLVRILYPTWYVACFLEDYRNSSVWGHYGDSHKGACLIFNVEDDSAHPCIQLRKIVGSSGHKDTSTGEFVSKLTWDYSPVLFYKISYQDEIQELDFFRSIGVLPTGKLISDWYTDRTGRRSKCSSHIGINDEETWRNSYWKKFYRDITVKTRDWAYEKEVRLILNSGMKDLSQPDTRNLTYRFSSLRGIIFGISMSDTDKVEAIDIILNKCREINRDSFEFYQAYYGHESKAIEAEKLDIRVSSG